MCAGLPFSLLFFVGIGLLCGASAVRAADAPATQPAEEAAPRYAPDPDTMLDRIRARLDALQLSDEQKQKIDDAFATAGHSFKMAEQELQNATRQQRIQHMRDIFQTLRESIRSTLSPQQQEEFRQKMAAAPGEMLNRLRDAVSKLEFSDDQKQKVHDLLEDVRSKMQQAGSEAKAGSQDGGEKMRAIGEDLRQKLGDILSDEQKLQLRGLMQNSNGPTTRPETN